MAESHREEIAKLESLYASNPGGRVFVHLAEALRKAGEFERARNILDEGLARHQDSASGYVVLGRLLTDLQSDDEAERAFTRVLQLDSGNLIALRALADLALRQGHSEEAAARYRDLLSRNPSSDDVRHLLTQLEAEGQHEAEGRQRAEHDQAHEHHRESQDEETEQQTPAPWQDASADALRGGQEGPQDASQVHDISPYSAAPGDGGATVPADAEYGYLETEEPATRFPHAAGAEPPDEEASAAGGSWADIAGREADLSDLELGYAGFVTDGQEEPATEQDAEADPVWDLNGSDLSLVDADELAPDAELAAETLDAQLFEIVEPEDGAWTGLGELAPDDRTDESAGESADDTAAGYEGSLDLTEAEESSQAAPATETPGAGRDDRSFVGGGTGTGGEGLLTETMADLYSRQGFHERAAEVYRALLRQRPGDERLAARLQEAEQAQRHVRGGPGEDEGGDAWLRGSGAAWAGTTSDGGTEATPYAWAQPQEETEGSADAGPQGPPIGSYLRNLVSWKPAAGGDQQSSPGDEQEFTAPDAVAEEPWAPHFTGDQQQPAETVAEPWAMSEEAPQPDPWQDDSARNESPMAGADAAPPRDAEQELEPWAWSGYNEAAEAATPVAETEAPTEVRDQPAWSAPVRPVDDVEAAFNEWYLGGDTEEDAAVESGPAPAAESAQAASSAPPPSGATGGEDDDEDLAMFRSWLQSLKK